MLQKVNCLSFKNRLIHVDRVHCFFGYTTAREVCEASEEWKIINKYIETVNEFVTMVFDMLEELENDKMAKIAMVLWTLRWKRNHKCWHDRNPSNFEVLRRA
jgi:hypothetical protein